MTPRLPHNWPNAEFSRFVERPAVRWHLQVAGAADTSPSIEGALQADTRYSARPVVLLLHGTGGSTHEWADVVPGLAAHAQILAPDLPGHGFSSGGEQQLSLSGMAEALGDLMQALDIHPDVIVGHSAGAAVALRLTLDGLAAPKAVLGLNPALIPPPDIWVDMLAPLAGLLVESSWLSRSAAWVAGRGSTVRSLLESSGARLSDGQVARYTELFTKPAHCAAALGMMNRWNLPALARDAVALRVPFTAYAGERDLWVPTRELAPHVERIPGAGLVRVPNVGHLMPEEAPGVVIEAVRGALG